ncbi:DUF2382 domain-containing protein [Croceicoccus sp. F390]|uniref:DUF2382 domain-containing protein n=1 Tax=Croceicoccus esteveae TaxID=3075597 RepID=A0ABU2ZJE2_9SPHN|nr:DUF2382 domain-containing protein [Croceicoccus sp. F390]MDT0576727.1 DUF2382 domain-containing protein [Croceicoccus sp. F390]
MEHDKTQNRSSREIVEEVAIPVVEERLVLDRQVIDGATVTVTTRPVTNNVAVREELRQETVTVERVPINRVIETVPQIREDGEVTIIPVVEERVTVTKELVLREEVHMRRSASTTTFEQDVTIRRMEVDIDDKPS